MALAGRSPFGFVYGEQIVNTSGIQQGLRRVLIEYPSARAQVFKENPLGEFVRNTLPDFVRNAISSRWLVKGSVGQGVWAETPWVSIFEPSVTTSAQRGVYVVYLFDQSGRHVYLSLNQATTEVKDEFKSRFKEVLASRAEFARRLLEPHGIDDLVVGELDLSGDRELTRGYCAGNIVAARYSLDNFPSEELIRQDLERILSLYSTYILVRNGEIGEEEEVPDGIGPGIESKRFRWHRRAERNARLSADAKRFHGSTCMICGFNFEARYGDRGRGYIEAHHVVPFAELAQELEPVLLDPRTDFVVVCANCHRMLHRTRPAISPEGLKEVLRQEV